MMDLYKSENEKILQERLIQRVEQYLDLKRRGFELGYKTYRDGYGVVYDSPYCRLSFYLSIDPRDKDDTIGISYGRHHAPNEGVYIVYQREKCLAWHNFVFGYIGQFLDGIPPRELARSEIEGIYVQNQARKLFEESGISKALRSPVWGLQLEQFTWEYYGERLFELFDRHYPQRWEVYRRFLYELYNEMMKDSKKKEILNRRPDGEPFPWQVC